MLNIDGFEDLIFDESDKVIQDDCLSYWVIIKKKKWTPIGLYRKCIGFDIDVYARCKESPTIYKRVVNLKQWVAQHKRAAKWSGEEFSMQSVMMDFRYID